MRVFTFFLFMLTIVAGCLSYKGLGDLTEIVKLTYAYLALSTVACASITLTMRPQVHAEPASVQQIESLE